VTADCLLLLVWYHPIFLLFSSSSVVAESAEEMINVPLVFLQNCHKLERLDLEECVFVSLFTLFYCIVCYSCECKNYVMLEHFQHINCRAEYTAYTVHQVV